MTTGIFKVKNGLSSPSVILTPMAQTGAPTSGTWSKGTIVTDSVGKNWRCIIAGTPGTWEQAGLSPEYWSGVTTDASAQEIFLSGVSNSRKVIEEGSSLVFRLLVVARKNSTNDSAAWELVGLIKRGSTNNTSLVGTVTKTVIAKDTALTDCDVSATADDTNESLKITVTGIADSTLGWIVS